MICLGSLYKSGHRIRDLFTATTNLTLTATTSRIKPLTIPKITDYMFLTHCVNEVSTAIV